jgi:hypothetical protein
VPIPPFGVDGWLPEGVHDASLAEVRERFGRFRRTDRRVRLFEALEALVAAAQGTGLVESIIVDGSFASAETNPRDVDVIVVLRSGVDFDKDLRPDQYNVLSHNRLRRLNLVDGRVVTAEGAELSGWLRFFARVHDKPAIRKGLVRVTL